MIADILDSIPEGTQRIDWGDYIPTASPQYWQLLKTLPMLASLSPWFRKEESGWRKVSRAEHREFLKEQYRARFHLLMTDPDSLYDYHRGYPKRGAYCCAQRIKEKDEL